MSATSSPRPSLVPPRPGRGSGNLVPSSRPIGRDEGRGPDDPQNEPPTSSPRPALDADLREAVETRLAERLADASRRRALRERARQEKAERRTAGLKSRHARKLNRMET